PSADPPSVKQQIEDVIGLDASQAILASAKEGTGIHEILEAIVRRIPPPADTADKALRALIFDSWYDSYRGVTALVRVKDGEVRVGQKIKLVATGKEYEVQSLGVNAPHPTEVPSLGPGEVGFLTAAIKDVADAKIGDRVTDAARPAAEALPGFKEVKPMVFAGLYPTDAADYPALRDALDKLHLNDSSITYEPETSLALGFGFRCGFLGLLHMEAIQERRGGGDNRSLRPPAPAVRYRCVPRDGAVTEIDNPGKLPSEGEIERLEEPIIGATIHVPTEFVG